MSGSSCPWQTAERVLLGAVIVLVVVSGVRLANQGRKRPIQPQPAPVAAPTAKPVPPVATLVAVATRPSAPSNLSPAGTALVQRIRACPPAELQDVVDTVSALEALSLYHQLTPADRLAVFTAVPSPILARKAAELLGIPQQSFLQVGTDVEQAGATAARAAALVDAALGTSESAWTPQQSLQFATVVDAQAAPDHPRTIFRPEERKIYACLDAGSAGAGETGVLVRWTESASGTLVYLHYLPLVANRRWNHVFFAVDEPWAPGSYQVSFFRIGASVGLLAEGTYVVRKPD